VIKLQLDYITLFPYSERAGIKWGNAMVDPRMLGSITRPSGLRQVGNQRCGIVGRCQVDIARW